MSPDALKGAAALALKQYRTVAGSSATHSAQVAAALNLAVAIDVWDRETDTLSGPGCQCKTLRCFCGKSSDAKSREEQP